MSDFAQYKNVYLICATNCPWDVDTAFMRRFQHRLYVPLPNKMERFELLKFLLKNTKLANNSSTYFEPLLDMTKGYSGSDLSSVVQNASQRPIIELMENKYWMIEDDMYHPWTGLNVLSLQIKSIMILVPNSFAILGEDEGIYCIRDFLKIPNNCAVARDINEMDLLAAVNVVKRTVSDYEIQKYNTYIDMH